MAGSNFALSVRAVVKIAGQAVTELEDPEAAILSNEAPYTCQKTIELEEGAEFSLNVLLGRGTLDLLLSADSGFMILVESDAAEVMRRLHTKKTPDVENSQQLCIEFIGILDRAKGSEQVLSKFRFPTSEVTESGIQGTIKIDLFIVKMLGPPEPGKLNDNPSSAAASRIISFEPGKKIKKTQVANTYEIKRLNHEQPFARFVFKYRTGVCMRSQVHVGAKPSDHPTTLLDLEEHKLEMNSLYVPIQAQIHSKVWEEVQRQAETEDNETISIQPIETTTCRKRKAVSAFGGSSPSRPKKIRALSE